MEKPAKRKPGRPPLGKRGNFTFRVRENVRERLIAAAESSNLSVSEEIERLLERQLTVADTVAEMFGGKENAQLLFMFAVAIQEVERATGKPWWTDKSTCEALQGAVDLILQSLKADLPEGWKPTEGHKYYPPLADLAPPGTLAKTRPKAPSPAKEAEAPKPREDTRYGGDRKFIDYFRIDDAAALMAMKAQLAARNAPAKAPEGNLPPSTSSSRKKSK